MTISAIQINQKIGLLQIVLQTFISSFSTTLLHIWLNIVSMKNVWKMNVSTKTFPSSLPSVVTRLYVLSNIKPPKNIKIRLIITCHKPWIKICLHIYGSKILNFLLILSFFLSSRPVPREIAARISMTRLIQSNWITLNGMLPSEAPLMKLVKSTAKLTVN